MRSSEKTTANLYRSIRLPNHFLGEAWSSSRANLRKSMVHLYRNMRPPWNNAMSLRSMFSFLMVAVQAAWYKTTHLGQMKIYEYRSTVVYSRPLEPLRDVARDRHGTHPTQGTCAIIDRADYTGPNPTIRWARSSEMGYGRCLEISGLWNLIICYPSEAWDIRSRSQTVSSTVCLWKLGEIIQRVPMLQFG